MSKIPTAEEFIEQNVPSTCTVLPEWLTEFAKLHVKAALKAAADNAELKAYPYSGCPECGRDDMYVDKKTILNAYPENFII